MFDPSLYNSSLEDAQNMATSLRGSLVRKTGFDNSAFVKVTKMRTGTTMSMRFTPNKEILNPDTPWGFWLPEAIINLKFAHHEDDSKVVRLNVSVKSNYAHGTKCITVAPASEMFEAAKKLEKQGKLAEAESLKSIARVHYTQTKQLMQGFLISAPGYAEDSVPENPIRKFRMGPQPFARISSAINPSTPEEQEKALKTIPTHFKYGYNFLLVKKQGPQFPHYNDSDWAREPSALTDAQLAALEKFGPWNLRDDLPKMPTDEDYALIRKIIDQSVESYINGSGMITWDPAWTDQLEKVRPFVVTKDDSRDDSDGGEPAQSVDTQSLRRSSRAVSAVASAPDAGDSTPEVTPPQAPKTPNAGLADIAAKVRAKVQAAQKK